MVSRFNHLTLKLLNSNNYRTHNWIIKLACDKQLWIIQCHKFKINILRYWSCKNVLHHI